MLAFIGGSGLYKIEGLEIIEELEIKTPFEEPSAPILVARHGNKKVLFLARHGKNHQYPPHRVPYRANIWALKEAGAKAIVGINAVGGINKLLQPGDFVIVDQFIDFTKSRENTFYEGIFSPPLEGETKNLPQQLVKEKKVVHIDVSEPFCPVLRKELQKLLEEKDFRYHKGGTYVATEGPRLETPAEIKAFALLGGDVVGMTMVPEVVLAKELQMHYAGLCVVTNPAAGIASYRLTSEEVIQMMKQKEQQIKEIVLSLIENYDNLSWDCQCEESLSGAIV